MVPVLVPASDTLFSESIRSNKVCLQHGCKNFWQYWVKTNCLGPRRDLRWNFTLSVLLPWKQLFPNVRAAKKQWHEYGVTVKWLFLSGERVLQKYKDMIKIFFQRSVWLQHYIFILEIIGMSTENGVINIQNLHDFLKNLENYPQNPLSKQKVRLLIFFCSQSSV